MKIFLCLDRQNLGETFKKFHALDGPWMGLPAVPITSPLGGGYPKTKSYSCVLSRKGKVASCTAGPGPRAH